MAWLRLLLVLQLAGSALASSGTSAHAVCEMGSVTPGVCLGSLLVNDTERLRDEVAKQRREVQGIRVVLAGGDARLLRSLQSTSATAVTGEAAMHTSGPLCAEGDSTFLRDRLGGLSDLEPVSGMVPRFVQWCIHIVPSSDTDTVLGHIGRADAVFLVRAAPTLLNTTKFHIDVPFFLRLFRASVGTKVEPHQPAVEEAWVAYEHLRNHLDTPPVLLVAHAESLGKRAGQVKDLLQQGVPEVLLLDTKGTGGGLKGALHTLYLRKFFRIVEAVREVQQHMSAVEEASLRERIARERYMAATVKQRELAERIARHQQQRAEVEQREAYRSFTRFAVLGAAVMATLGLLSLSAYILRPLHLPVKLAVYSFLDLGSPPTSRAGLAALQRASPPRMRGLAMLREADTLSQPSTVQ